VHGLGIALLPAWVLRTDIGEGRLVTLLTEFEVPPLPIHAVMPRGTRDLLKVRVALAHFEASLARLG
jgi:DNA-binding transcriptional LysR family regulator